MKRPLAVGYLIQSCMNISVVRLRKGQALPRLRRERYPWFRMSARLLAMHRVKLRCRSIDVELKDVRPIVVAGEVVPQLHRNRHLEVAIGIENAFLGTHRSRDDPEVGCDDHAATTI